jgi:ABC-type multidrug transport system fused ATPase/permease subunit
MVKTFDLAANRIFGIVDGDEFTKEEFGQNELTKFDGNIEFKNVNFSYEDKVPVLKNMSFKINANETVAFVGSSGSGKSTIFNLISAVNKVKKGTITFDGIDINKLSKHSIRGNLSIISQNPYIYNMSIKDNLKIIKKDATMTEIRDVCRMACLDDFIEGLPKKYNTIVGEGGVTLSGGQKQRLAIARALLLKTEIILFDEATSALDNVTQAKIQQAINNMKGEYTILIIAHRITTVKNADKIFVIDNGKIMDVGTHQELLKNSRTYKKLYSEELESEE